MDIEQQSIYKHLKLDKFVYGSKQKIIKTTTQFITVEDDLINYQNDKRDVYYFGKLKYLLNFHDVNFDYINNKKSSVSMNSYIDNYNPTFTISANIVKHYTTLQDGQRIAYFPLYIYTPIDITQFKNSCYLLLPISTNKFVNIAHPNSILSGVDSFDNMTISNNYLPHMEFYDRAAYTPEDNSIPVYDMNLTEIESVKFSTLNQLYYWIIKWGLQSIIYQDEEGEYHSLVNLMLFDSSKNLSFQQLITQNFDTNNCDSILLKPLINYLTSKHYLYSRDKVNQIISDLFSYLDNTSTDRYFKLAGTINKLNTNLLKPISLLSKQKGIYNAKDLLYRKQDITFNENILPQNTLLIDNLGDGLVYNNLKPLVEYFPSCYTNFIHLKNNRDPLYQIKYTLTTPSIDPIYLTTNNSGKVENISYYGVINNLSLKEDTPLSTTLIYQWNYTSEAIPRLPWMSESGIISSIPPFTSTYFSNGEYVQITENTARRVIKINKTLNQGFIDKYILSTNTLITFPYKNKLSSFIWHFQDSIPPYASATNILLKLTLKESKDEFNLNEGRSLYTTIISTYLWNYSLTSLPPYTSGLVRGIPRRLTAYKNQNIEIYSNGNINNKTLYNETELNTPVIITSYWNETITLILPSTVYYFDLKKYYVNEKIIGEGIATAKVNNYKLENINTQDTRTSLSTALFTTLTTTLIWNTDIKQILPFTSATIDNVIVLITNKEAQPVTNFFNGYNIFTSGLCNKKILTGGLELSTTVLSTYNWNSTITTIPPYTSAAIATYEDKIINNQLSVIITYGDKTSITENLTLNINNLFISGQYKNNIITANNTDLVLSTTILSTYNWNYGIDSILPSTYMTIYGADYRFSIRNNLYLHSNEYLSSINEQATLDITNNAITNDNSLLDNEGYISTFPQRMETKQRYYLNQYNNKHICDNILSSMGILDGIRDYDSTGTSFNKTPWLSYRYINAKKEKENNYKTYSLPFSSYSLNRLDQWLKDYNNNNRTTVVMKSINFECPWGKEIQSGIIGCPVVLGKACSGFCTFPCNKAVKRLENETWGYNWNIKQYYNSNKGIENSQQKLNHSDNISINQLWFIIPSSNYLQIIQADGDIYINDDLEVFITSASLETNADFNKVISNISFEQELKSIFQGFWNRDWRLDNINNKNHLYPEYRYSDTKYQIAQNSRFNGPHIITDGTQIIGYDLASNDMLSSIPSGHYVLMRVKSWWSDTIRCEGNIKVIKNTNDISVNDYDFIETIDGFFKFKQTGLHKSNIYSIKLNNTGLGLNNDKKYKEYTKAELVKFFEQKYHVKYYEDLDCFIVGNLLNVFMRQRYDSIHNTTFKNTPLFKHLPNDKEGYILNYSIIPFDDLISKEWEDVGSRITEDNLILYFFNKEYNEARDYNAARQNIRDLIEGAIKKSITKYMPADTSLWKIVYNDEEEE